MKLSKSARLEHLFRIHAIAPDFAVEDVWALPASGGEGELPHLVDALFASNFPQDAPVLVRFLWEARRHLGRLYMAGIAPLHYLFVYPALFRQIGCGWEATAPDRQDARSDTVDQRSA